MRDASDNFRSVVFHLAERFPSRTAGLLSRSFSVRPICRPLNDSSMAANIFASDSASQSDFTLRDDSSCSALLGAGLEGRFLLLHLFEHL